jgi:hypothetical protein
MLAVMRTLSPAATKGCMMRNHLPLDDAALWTRSARSHPIRIEVHEVRYLDLSGDGVPDAVEHITRHEFRADRSDLGNSVEEIRRLEYGIGIDGKPAGVIQRTCVFARDHAEPVSKSSKAVAVA